MRMKIAVLALGGIGIMATGAFAQSFYYEKRGKHHRFGISVNFGHSRSSYRHSYRSYGYPYSTRYYTSRSYYVPAYGYHTHHVDSHVTPYSGRTTRYDHVGRVHAPSRTTTYYYSPYRRTSTYYRYR